MKRWGPPSEKPSSYWRPFLLPLLPDQVGGLTPQQLDACWDHYESRVF